MNCATPGFPIGMVLIGVLLFVVTVIFIAYVIEERR